MKRNNIVRFLLRSKSIVRIFVKRTTGEEDENVKSLQQCQRRRTTNKFRSKKLTGAFGSGELKRREKIEQKLRHKKKKNHGIKFLYANFCKTEHFNDFLVFYCRTDIQFPHIFFWSGWLPVYIKCIHTSLSPRSGVFQVNNSHSDQAPPTIQVGIQLFFFLVFNNWKQICWLQL